MRWIQFSSFIFTGLLLTACGSSGNNQLPKNTPKIAGSWKHLGNISGGNIVVSYDAGSLKKSGNLAWLRDRKIVINPEHERYTNTPRYKVVVNDWEFNCRNQSYRLTAVQFLDEKGYIVSQERYTSNPIPPMPIPHGTIADKQFKIVCR